jgi:FKBP-type peptidyl-prolyl cis-trans isomerase SlyD
MTDTIQDEKYVELTYQVIDQKTGEELVAVEFPLGYVHGVNEILMPDIMDELEGKSAGHIVEVPFNGNDVFGARDETLVFTDHLENVPEEYQKVGVTVHAENESGDVRNFIVTRVDDKTVTLDGNHPLCGREVLFKLEVLSVRDATKEEIDAGGPVGQEGPDVDKSRMVPI